MRKRIFTLFTLCFFAWNVMHAQTDFAEGNLVVLSVGSGSETLAKSGNTVYLNEYDTTGTLIQSFALPSTGTDKLILSGTDEYCGYLNRSANEKYLTLAGFDATIGQVPDLDASDAATINRTVAIIDAEANIDLSTKMSTSLANATSYTPRGVVSTDGNDLWVSAPTFVKSMEGEGGIFYIQKGNTSRVSDINRRNYAWTNVKLFNNKGNSILFAAVADRRDGQIRVGLLVNETEYDDYTITVPDDVSEIPTAFPVEGTSFGYTDNIVSFANNYLTDFVLIDQSASVSSIDVAYIANRESTGGTLTKCVGTGDLGFNTTYYSLTDNSYNYYGITEGSVTENSVVLYATRENTGSSNFELVKITDNSGYNGDPSGKVTIEVLATAASGTVFRGIALAPVSGKTVQTIGNFSNIEKTYGDADFKLEATASSGNKVAYTVKDAGVATVDANGTIHIVGAGTTEIYASVEGNDEYKPAEATIVLSVAKALQQATDYTQLSGRKVKTSDPDFTINVTLTSGLKPYYVSEDEGIATVDYSSGLVHIVSAGTVKIYVLEDGSNNYESYSDYVSVKIIEASEQQITNFENVTKTIDDADFQLNAAATSGGDITYSIDSAHVATVSGNTVHIVGKGIAHITAYQAGNGTYDPVEKTITLTVKYAQSIQNFNSNINKTWGDEDFYLGATATSGLDVSYEVEYNSFATVDHSTGLVHILKTGVTSIIAHQKGNDNYAAADDIIITLTIGKADQEISNFSDITKTYGDADFKLEASVTSGEAITYTISDASVATISNDTVHIVAEGSTEITATQAGTSNYKSVSKTISLSVGSATKTSQTISNFSDITKTYGDTDFTLAATASSGLEVTYTIADTSIASISSSTVHIKKGGITTVTAKQAGNATYNTVSASITLTVNKLAQTLTVSSNIITKTTNDDDFALDITASSGLEVTYSSSSTSVATIDGDTVRIVGTGVTTITAKQEGNDFYEAVEVAIMLTVTKYTSIEQEEASEAMFSLFPNPVTQGTMELVFGTAQNNRIVSILDITGKRVHSQVVEKGTESLIIDVGHLKGGIYFVCLSNKNGQVVKKIVKK